MQGRMMWTWALAAVLGACRSEKATPTDTGTVSGGAVDADGDGFLSDEDCNDSDSAVSPEALELCDGIDNDCDGDIDEGVTSTFHADTDGDGFGDPETTTAACSAPSGYVAVGNDCNDADADSHPGAAERCDEADNDCDGDIDEDVTTTWYADGDNDGHGDPEARTDRCDPPSGYVESADDCDDTNDTAFPGGVEVCDEVDNDCDGTVDEEVTATFYQDTDADGYGISDATTESCDRPTGYAAEPGDCDDSTAAVSPAQTEVCNGIDDDCDGTADGSDAADALRWYADSDSDGHGDTDDAGVLACAQPSGYAASHDDCDDTTAEASPDAAEVCDGIDNDCDGTADEASATDAATWYTDADGDGYGTASSSTVACTQPLGFAAVSGDCDDSSKAVSPAGTEVCDGIDNDCDGTADEASAADAATWYTDADGDGYGTASSSTVACAQPSGSVGNDDDCDDSSKAISPAGTEVCNGVDDDCDGTVDNDDAADALDWYRDADSDGYGSAASSTTACEAPSGYVGDDTDCNDGDGGIYPGAEETCDGTDEDCSGVVDDGAATGALSSCAASNCQEVLDNDPTATDGAYWIAASSGSRQLLCDMTDDGGGWTLVANFVWPGSTAGVSGWATSSAVGSSYTSTSSSFKLSDADINGLVVDTYRAWGEASYCYDGPCSVDITLFWDGSCTYTSGGSSTGACAKAYRDVDLTDATGWNTPCSWHYGLTSVACGTVSEMGTSHTGNHVFAGVEDSFSHAYSGRSSEDPSVMVWVR